ncbi:MAG TPA: AMP-binding protein [Geminicoccaceae bacterium]|nr:AMP-binding protein [Geminicoccaceae bacterium]
MALRTLGCLVDGLADDAEAGAIIAHHAETPTTWTRRRLRDEIERFAKALIAAGLRAGEPVALVAASRPEWAAAMLAIARTGAVAMPISEQSGPSELERILGHSHCRRVITTSDHLKALAKVEGAGELAVLLLDDADADRHGLSVQGWHDLPDGSGELPALEPDQPAVLVYTSGTTGTPKGVPLTHANLCANLDALVAERLARPGDRVLLPLPLQHVYPLTVGLLAPLASGAAVVLPAGITGPQISEALQQCACTIMIAVPRLYEAMLAGIERRMDGLGAIALGIYRRLLAFSTWLFRHTGWRAGRLLFFPLHRQVGPSLRLLAAGGAPLKPETAWQLNGLGWEVLVGYGLSETSPILTFNPKGRARIGSVGLPVKDTEIRIAPVPDVEPGTGEIEARGPSVFAGYWHNEEATKEAFTEDGFFRTGDLGRIDHDGYLYIVGRSKEMIVVAGGKNIFPEDVESVYGKSELIQELAVLDHDGRLVALIVPQVEPEGAGGRLRQRFRDEIERLGQDLPSYERITDFALTAQTLPRTQIGKLRRHLLPDLYARAKSTPGAVEEATLTEEDQALLERTPADQVWAWLQRRFKGTRLTLDTSPELDLGLDSFEWMSLAMELQERFGFRLTEEDLARISTLRALLQEVQQAADSGQTQALADGELGVEQERWLQPRGAVLRALAWLFFMLNYAVMRGLFRVRAEGLEHLPEQGPYLITPNHTSYLDPFAVAAVLSWKQLQQVYWAGWSGLLFRGPVTRTFSRITQVVPVDPERGLTSTLLFARAILNRGNVLTWFPEGERSRDGQLERFLPGAGMLIQKTRVPAVPVLIVGSYEAWPPTRSLPRPHPIRLRFGEPLMLADSEPDSDDMDGSERIAERLRDAVIALGAKTGDPPLEDRRDRASA